MLTKNWYAQLRSAMRKTIEKGTLTDVTGTAVNSGWYSQYPQRFMFGVVESGSIVLSSKSGFAVGSGSKEASVNDYKLESMITSGISGSWEVVDGSYRITITNNSSEPVTINEVGYMENCYYSTDRSSKLCLIDRTVLTNPITIQPGAAGVIDYSVDLHIPVE